MNQWTEQETHYENKRNCKSNGSDDANSNDVCNKIDEQVILYDNKYRQFYNEIL